GNCGVMVETNNGGSDWSVNHISNLDSIEVIKFLDDSLGFLLGYSGYSDSAARLYKTIDGGVRWSRISAFPTNTWSFHFVGENVGWIYSDGNLFKTVDGGENWSDETPEDFPFTRSIYFCNDTTGWAGGIGTAIFKTNDGENWDRVAIDGMNYLEIYSIKFLNSDIGWAVGVANYGRGIILYTENGGDSWTSQFITQAMNLFYDLSFVNQNICCVISINGRVYCTNDGGDHWAPLEGTVSENELRSIQLKDDSTGWIVGDFGEIYRTFDGGMNWVEQSYGFKSYLYDICFIDSLVGWVVGYNFSQSDSLRSISKTNNGGLTWSYQETGLENEPHLRAVFFIDEQTGWIGGDHGIFMKTEDSGESWTNMEVDANPIGIVYDIFFLNSDVGWVVGNDSLFLATNDGGENWSIIDTDNSSALFSIFFLDDSTGWILQATSSSSGVLRTNDGGRTWENLENIEGNRIFKDIFFKNENEGWAAGGREIYMNNYSYGIGLIWQTDNGGETWNINDSSASHMYQAISFSDSSKGFVVGISGTSYKTDDSGDTWNILDINSKNDITNIFFINPQTGWLIGSNGTVFRTDVGGINSIKSEILNTTIPIYSIEYYPNPFNVSSTIIINLNKNTIYKLSIYNILGRNVIDLFDGFGYKGKHSFSWNGYGNDGLILPSGIYFIRFSMEQSSEVRKVFLLK
ncbi:MAG: YCF48-related protein, partial [Candidatus Electryonea clarkiae]|nr:YCF48-related protein [Candidatus Electryonea clarkiae]